MSWLIVAKMPLLISSRMTSAGLTDSSSASSLTVIVAGSSTAPRSRGSATWTADWNVPSRRGGLRGPRRPRVPLLLLAMGASDQCAVTCSGDEDITEVRRNWRLQGAAERAAVDRGRDTGLVAAHVRAATIGPGCRIKDHAAAGLANHPQEVALLTRGPTGDAGTGRRAADAGRSGGRPGAYDDTSSSVFPALAARGLAAVFAVAAFGAAFTAAFGAAFAAFGAAFFTADVGPVGVGFAALTAVLRAAVFFAGAATSAATPSVAASAASAGAAATMTSVGFRAAPAAAALASATDTSLRMSIRQPVRRAASRAFWPSRPIASESIRSGTGTFRIRCSWSISTERTCAGDRAFATNAEGSSLQGMTSIFSPPSSATTAWTRAPRWPTVAPTGSRPSWREPTATFERLPASRAIAPISTVPPWISGASSSKRPLREPLWVRLTKIWGPRVERRTSRT